MTIPNTVFPFVRDDLRLSRQGVQLLESMQTDLAELKAFKAAVMAIVDPTGGSTQDTEARAAIVAIIDAAQ